jgi:hypothetical protein
MIESAGGVFIVRMVGEEGWVRFLKAELEHR